MKLNPLERMLVNNPLRLVRQRRVLASMREMAEPLSKAVILEIGCGRGEGGRLLHRCLSPAGLVLMDLDPAMAALARGKGAEVLVGDAEALPLASGSFDAVFGFGFLHHVPDWRAALGEVARVLRPGGIYYLEEFYPPAYQNALVRHLLQHPNADRFHAPDLRTGLAAVGLHLMARRERTWFGIVAAARKG